MRERRRASRVVAVVVVYGRDWISIHHSILSYATMTLYGAAIGLSLYACNHLTRSGEHRLSIRNSFSFCFSLFLLLLIPHPSIPSYPFSFFSPLILYISFSCFSSLLYNTALLPCMWFIYMLYNVCMHSKTLAICTGCFWCRKKKPAPSSASLLLLVFFYFYRPPSI